MLPEKERSKEFGTRVSPHIINEYGKLKKVLVVPTPSVITANKDIPNINPIFEKTRQNSNSEEKYIVYPGAPECHAKLLKVLEDHGVSLIYSNVIPTLEYHTPLFTRDVGVIIEDVYIPSSMNFGYRQVEVPSALAIINSDNVFLTDIPYKIEGGDVVYLEKDLLLIGIGPRTDANGLNLLKFLFPEKEIVSFSTVRKDKAFHIDTNLGILGEKLLVYLPELVPAEIVSFLTERGYTFVEASPEEYETCCTNVLALSDRKVIAPAENIETNNRIRQSGVEVIEVELKDILSFGGGPHCLTLPLLRE